MVNECLLVHWRKSCPLWSWWCFEKEKEWKKMKDKEIEKKCYVKTNRERNGRKLIRGRAALFAAGLSWFSSTPSSESNELTSISEGWLTGGGASVPCFCAGAFAIAGGGRVSKRRRGNNDCVLTKRKREREREKDTFLFFNSQSTKKCVYFNISVWCSNDVNMREWYAISGFAFKKKKKKVICLNLKKNEKKIIAFAFRLLLMLNKGSI